MRRTLVALLSALLLLAGCGQQGNDPIASVQTNDDGWNGTRLSTPWPASSLALTSDQGEELALDKADGRLRLVFFGYTQCPDICHIVMGTIASAMARLDKAERQAVEVVFVSTDPARDKPAVLREYLDRFDPAYVGLYGPLKTVIAVAEPLKVYVAEGRRLPSGGYEVDHTAAVVAVRDGEAVAVWTQGVTPPALAADVKKLLEEDS